MDTNMCYNASFQTYSASKNVTPDPKCNGWTAVNTGGANVLVNGFLLKPYPPGHPELTGAAVGFMGNKGEVYVGNINIVFDGTGSSPEVTIIQKFYVG